MRKRTKLASAMVTALVAATMVLPVSSAAAVDDIDSAKLRNAVTVNGILTHERALQRIANNNGGTRVSGSPGFDASAAYVTKQLKSAGYTVKQQKFDFPYFEELAPSSFSQDSPTPTDYINGTDFDTMDYSGSGEVTGAVVPTNDILVPPGPTPSSSSAGCEASDFTPASATEPQVALIQRGTCDFSVKAANAQAAGYDAVLIFNEGQPGRDDLLLGTLGAPFALPALGLTYAAGAALYAATQAGPLVVTISTDTLSEVRSTRNVIAESKKGDPNKVVVVGAHLDSVAEGPGINDNGSGTATILETAIQMSKLNIVPRQKLRFAFWGAEESGLLGSTYYVSQLNDNQLAKIYANLNFDMLGSPNYVRFVYDGDGSGDPAAAGPPGSAQIEAIFDSYFASQNLATEPTDFDGRSDYGPFIEAGIPAGGLFSGAEGVKTAEQAAIFGGTAGAAYDPCYHQACDNLNNLSTKALYELGDAAAHSILTLAKTKSGFFEDGSRMAARQAVSTLNLDYRGGHLVR
ncbi:MAG: M28 family metallopeptidase [Nakamurella sp.]